jgi:hypothetical protein
MSDHPIAEAANYTLHKTHTRDEHQSLNGFRTYCPNIQAAADLNLRPHGYKYLSTTEAQLITHICKTRQYSEDKTPSRNLA